MVILIDGANDSYKRQREKEKREKEKQDAELALQQFPITQERREYALKVIHEIPFMKR